MNSKLRVMQINAVYGVSSTGRNCMELDEASEEYGIEMYTAYAVEGPYKPKRGYVIGSNLDRKLHALVSRVSGLQGYASVRATQKLLEYIDEVDPKVVHLNNLHSNFIHLKILFRYLSKKKISVVITLHDCWFYTGRCTHYTLDNCNRWKEHCGKCPRLKKDIPSWMFDRSEKMLSDKKKWYQSIEKLTVVGVSDWITNEAKSSDLFLKAKFRRIHNWIDIDKFHPSAKNRELYCDTFGIDPSKFIIIGVSTLWSTDKGLDRFVALSEILSDDFVIVLVGSIPQGYTLNRRIINIPQTHSVSELAMIYASADLLLNLSKEETFGKVTAESLSCGTPVILSNLTANPELVETGTGYIVNVDSYDTIVKSINKVKNKGKKAFSDRCRESSVLRFNRSDRVAEYMKLYSEIACIKNSTHL